MELTTKFTKELLQKAKSAESAEALQALAKENDYEISTEEANAYFAQLHKRGELSDEELENVSGGGCRKDGHLVTSLINGCLKWSCKVHKMPTVQFKDGYSSCASYAYTGCTNSLYCKSCYYCHYEKGLWLCYNPEK